MSGVSFTQEKGITLFFSRPHQPYSRIDLFLISQNQLHAVKGSTIGNITWSDHAPVSMKYALADYFRGQRNPWRLNESLLQNPEVVADVTTEITQYFHTNTTADGNGGLIWEAHKAVIRGVLIKHGARLKRQRTAQLTTLLTELRSLERDHKQTPNRARGSELDMVRTQITDLLQYKEKAALQISRKRIYELGNKCSRLLAQSLKAQKTATYIPHIYSPTGQKKTIPQQITQEFMSHYKTLIICRKRQPLLNI